MERNTSPCRGLYIRRLGLGLTLATALASTGLASKVEAAPDVAKTTSDRVHKPGHPIHRRRDDGGAEVASALEAMRQEMSAQKLRADAQQVRIESLQRQLASAELARSDAATAAVQARTRDVDEMAKAIGSTRSEVAQLDAKVRATPVRSAPPALGAPRPLVAGLDLTLYGRADLAATESSGYSAKGVAVKTYRFNQAQTPNRLGLRGGYTLSDDMKVTFAVESGLTLFNGGAGGAVQNTTATSSLFNRGATLGLESKKLGSLDAGLMFMAPFWVALLADQSSANGYGAGDQSALYSLMRPESLGRYLSNPATNAATNFSKTTTLAGANSGTALFYSNALRYRTPDLKGALKGLRAEVSYSMGQQAFSTTPIAQDGRTWAANVIYTSGPLFLGYGHMNYRQNADLALPSAAVADFVRRDQSTDILGAHYKIGDLELGAADTIYSVSHAGGYRSNTFGVSGAYLFGKNRLEVSLSHISYAGANARGAYGKNIGDGKGAPVSNSLGVTYMYKILPRLAYYTSYSLIRNNAHAELGVLDFRADEAAFGRNPSQISTGLLFTF